MYREFLLDSPLYSWLKYIWILFHMKGSWYEQSQHSNLTERQKVKVVIPSVCQVKIKIFSDKVLYQTLLVGSHGTSETFSVFPELAQEQNQENFFIKAVFLLTEAKMYTADSPWIHSWVISNSLKDFLFCKWSYIDPVGIMSVHNAHKE